MKHKFDVGDFVVHSPQYQRDYKWRGMRNMVGRIMSLPGVARWPALNTGYFKGYTIQWYSTAVPPHELMVSKLSEKYIAHYGADRVAGHISRHQWRYEHDIEPELFERLPIGSRVHHTQSDDYGWVKHHNFTKSGSFVHVDWDRGSERLNGGYCVCIERANPAYDPINDSFNAILPSKDGKNYLLTWKQPVETAKFEVGQCLRGWWVKDQKPSDSHLRVVKRKHTSDGWEYLFAEGGVIRGGWVHEENLVDLDFEWKPVVYKEIYDAVKPFCKFKVGDRVRDRMGDKGTIVSVSGDQVDIHFDIDDEDGPTYIDEIYGASVPVENLELVAHEPVHVDMQVTDRVTWPGRRGKVEHISEADDCYRIYWYSTLDDRDWITWRARDGFRTVEAISEADDCYLDTRN